MLCPACGQETREGARFCGACASSLSSELSCPSCGEANPAGQNFCDSCAHPLGDATASPLKTRPAPASYTPKHLADRILDTRSAIEGERKIVTVLFADVVDSMPLAERSDPEEMHSLMDRCFQAILPEVHRYEGTINQFQGDGFMALFGAPIALEDAPRRACLAALAIHEALAPLREEVRARHGVDFQWRIGIHGGPVVVGRIGDDLRMDYTAVGDTTNLAARLEKAAPAGGILISDATQRLVTGLFDTEDLGELHLKGKSEPTHVHQVLSERPVSRMEADAHRGLTPLCGRDRELSSLRRAFDGARLGRGQVVFVVGEAGIGKSRLVHEFRRQLVDEPHTFFLGLCVSYGRARFQPIVDGLRRLAGIEDTDDEATAETRVEEMVHRFGSDLGWTLPFVRDLLSLPVGDTRVEELDAIIRRSETVKALNAIFLAAAAREPLIIAIEDLHWIDPASEEFLAGLIDSAPASRIVLLLAYRPGYQQPFGDRSYFTRIALQALSDSQMGEMARAVLEGATLPTGLRDLIASKAEGNPLFIEEVTRSLVEDGALSVTGGRVELTREIAEITIPDRIHDVLAARIDRLEEGPKQAIQIASVIGREFAMRLLQRLIEAGGAIEAVVGELRALELFVETHAHPELAFMFKHALTHDVAYQSVLSKRRRTLHGIVAVAIEELYADRLAEHYEKLAHHFELAEHWERAFKYHRRSAKKAARTWANQAAAEHCRRAIANARQMTQPPPADQLYEIELLLGACCMALSDFRQAGEARARAAELAPSPAARSRQMASASYAFLWAHDYPRTESLVAESLAIARAHDAPGSEALGLICQDHAMLIRGESCEDGRIEKAIELAELAEDPEALVVGLSLQAGHMERAGDFGAAIAVCERAIKMAVRAHMAHMSAFATWFLGISQCCLGRYEIALTSFREALAVCERIGDHAVKPRLLNTLGWCYAEFDCHDRAIECNERSTALAREMVEQQLVEGAPELYANGSINLAGNRLALGDADGALRALEPIAAQMTSDDDPWMRWRYSLHLLDAQARVALVRGEVDDALAHSASELEGSRASRSRKIEARALELHGRALLVADRRDDAEAALMEAIEVAEAIGYPPIQWRAPSLLAEIARRRGNAVDAAHHAQQARATALRFAEALSPELRPALVRLGERLEQDPLAAYF
jgi:class 3 adenylate cyclase/tetratricopeptide (TPR) repeat protein